MSDLRAYGWEGMNLIRLHSYADHHHCFFDGLRRFAEAPGKFAGVVELDANFTSEGDEEAEEGDEWLGEHVHIILKELHL